MDLHGEVARLEDRCTELRRSLHMIPETKYEEYETQAFIIRALEKLSPDKLEKLAGTGVKAVFYSKGAKKTIAFRADMDALDTEERNDVPYASMREGQMHACGHDGHMTVLLLLAELIAGNRGKIKQNVVLLFQPAEEGGGGAKRMIKAGALLNPEVDRIYGLHVWPAIDKGKIGIRWGVMMAQTAEFDIVVHGRSAHGASPQMGIDAVVIAAELISMLQTMITRGLDPHEDALLTIGKISGGVARNIIADRVELNATLRVLEEATYDKLTTRISEIVQGFGMATGAKFDVKYQMAYPCVTNPRWMVEDLYQYSGMEDIVLVEPTLAAEDFSCYQQEVPGIFFFLGISGGKNHAPLHNSKFDFDEDVLLKGAELFWRLASDMKNE